MLSALNGQPEVTTHIRTAIEVGDITKDEVQEMLLHVVAYCCTRTAIDAFRTAKE
jgi:alkylhydroperoxidase/carboxymuconolactone decarboxylase family protein YurZ